MGKHVDKKVKYHYVMRYINGESAIKLGWEVGPNLRDPDCLIHNWHRRYQKFGIKGLESKTGVARGNGKGRPKKEKLNYDDLTREELIKIIEIKDEFIDHFKKKMRPRFVYEKIASISKKHKVTIGFICLVLQVSKSGYYKWLGEPKVNANYNQVLLDKILEAYLVNNGNFGAERIWKYLELNQNIKLNIKTIKRYMRHLDIKAKIRVPKRKREIKETSTILKNHINRNWKDDSSREKVFTDTTEYSNANVRLYFSATISSCGNYLLDLNVSLHNDSWLIQENIINSVTKIGRKYYLHFDNAAFYKNQFMIDLVTKTGGIRSYSYPGESLDNRPVEYFFSILKLEYLRIYKPKCLEEAKSICQKIMFDYNKLRIQKCLNWKTPANARV